MIAIYHVTLLMLQGQLHKRTTMDFEKTSFEMSISALKNGISQVDRLPSLKREWKHFTQLLFHTKVPCSQKWLILDIKKLIKNNSENSAISFIEDRCSSLSRRICCDLSKLSRMPQSFYEGHV